MREAIRIPRWVLMVGIPSIVIAIVTGAWLIDRARHADTVQRNVSVAGETVGGLSDADLLARIDLIAAQVSRSEIVIETVDGSSRWTAGELGVGVDVEATFAAVKAAGSGASGPIGWLGRVVSLDEVEVELEIDLDTTRSALQATDVLRTEPVEPTIEVIDSRLQVIDARPGHGIDVEDVVAKLPAAVATGRFPIVVEAELAIVQARLGAEDLRGPVDAANALIDTTLEVQINDFQTTIPREMVASWFRSEVTDEGAVVDLEIDRILPDLETLMAPGATGSGVATFDVVDGEVRIVSSDGGTVCCAANAPYVVQRALQRGLAGAVHDLPTRPAVPREGVDELESLGVVELVASFTTYHPCCQGRVSNIQKFADYMHGAVIAPGGSLSLNDYVGRRTEERGFVAGGFISKGVLVQDIGGGVSQFATTIFNTAFFAGLDFDSYQAHSIYFSRYPYGREATISFPEPDLVIRNSTDYGVLIWTRYTPTSITVEMYSTKHIEVEALDPRTTFADQCRRATTRRIRTYPDGREVIDSVFAVYRPEEGLNCDGSVSDPSLTTTTTTTTTAPTTTAPSTTAPPTTAPPTTAPPTTAPPTTASPTTTTTTTTTTTAPEGEGD